MTSVAIALPTGNTVTTEFAMSLAVLVAHPESPPVTLLNHQNASVEIARNTLVRAFLGREETHLLFIDSDMIFPADGLSRLLSHEKPVVCATYVRRHEPFEALGVGLDDIDPGATGLARMARVPTGFLLVRRDVFERAEFPWFDCPWDERASAFMSDDYFFSERARTAGYDLCCDLDLSHEMGHVGQIARTWGRVTA